MPYIDMANIACGFHGSDAYTIQKTIRAAKQHQVSIGAHPSYPDVENFGRCSMQFERKELIAIIQYQIGALQALCQVEAVHLSYVKPHGALYNDMMRDLSLFETICLAVSQINQANQHSQLNLNLMIQALPDTSAFQAIAKQHNIILSFEAFADRNYQDNGLLVPRTEANAVIKDQQVLVQRCQDLLNKKPLLSQHATALDLHIDTLCVHGDTPNALQMLKALHQTINNHLSASDHTSND